MWNLLRDFVEGENLDAGEGLGSLRPATAVANAVAAHIFHGGPTEIGEKRVSGAIEGLCQKEGTIKFAGAAFAFAACHRSLSNHDHDAVPRRVGAVLRIALHQQ